MRLTTLAATFALIAATLLASCSRLDLAYRWMDRVIAKKVGDALDLTGDQRNALEELIGREKRRILKEWGPRYASELRSLSAAIRSPELTGPALAARYSQGAKLIRLSLAGLEGPLVELLQGLSPEQRRRFLERAEERMKDTRKDLESPRARRKEQKRRLVYWMDLLGVEREETQDVLLEEFLDQIPYPFDLEASSQLASLKRLAEAFGGPEKLKTYLHELFTDPEKARSREFAPGYGAYFVQVAAFEARLFRSLGERQKTRIEKRLADYAVQLDELSRRD